MSIANTNTSSSPELPEPVLPQPDVGGLDEEGDWKYDVDELPQEGGLGAWLRSIDRDSFIGLDSTRNAGAGLAAGCGAYISMVHQSLVPDEVAEAVPEFSYSDIPDVPGIEMPEYSDIDHYVPVDLGALKDETRHHLNREVTEWDEFEGVGEVDTYQDLIEEAPNMVENAPEIIGTSFDQFAHFGISGTASTILAGAADMVGGEEYDPKSVAIGGMATVPLFFVFKEGWYEGGNSIAFDMESMDVRGDLISDTLGAAYGTYSYHKKKTVTEETEPGMAGSLARKIGRFTAKAENALRRESGEPDIEAGEFEPDLLEETKAESEGDLPELETFKEPELEMEGENITVVGSYSGESYGEEITAEISVDETLGPSDGTSESTAV